MTLVNLRDRTQSALKQLPRMDVKTNKTTLYERMARLIDKSLKVYTHIEDFYENARMDFFKKLAKELTPTESSQGGEVKAEILQQILAEINQFVVNFNRECANIVSTAFSPENIENAPINKGSENRGIPESPMVNVPMDRIPPENLPGNRGGPHGRSNNQNGGIPGNRVNAQNRGASVNRGGSVNRGFSGNRRNPGN